MSKFSGKCDLYDWFGEIACNKGETPYECYKRLGSKIIVGDRIEKREMEIKKPSDLVMFYPFVSYAHFHSATDEPGRDLHYIPMGSFLSEVVTYSPDSAAFYLDAIVKEYWRVKEEEDPKYVV